MQAVQTHLIRRHVLGLVSLVALMTTTMISLTFYYSYTHNQWVQGHNTYHTRMLGQGSDILVTLSLIDQELKADLDDLSSSQQPHLHTIGKLLLEEMEFLFKLHVESHNTVDTELIARIAGQWSMYHYDIERLLRGDKMDKNELIRENYALRAPLRQLVRLHQVEFDRSSEMMEKLYQDSAFGLIIALLITLSIGGPLAWRIVYWLRQTEENLLLTRYSYERSTELLLRFNENGNIVDVNQTTLTELRVTRDQVLGQHINEFQMGLALVDWSGFWEDLRQKGRFTSECRFRGSDGRIIPVDVDVLYLEFDGQGYGYLAARDISERKKHEQIKREFVSTVSHELRTPLTSIRGALGLVCNGVVGQMPESARGVLEAAERNSERLSNLINDLLDIEKIESGGMRFDLQKHDLVTLINQSIEANQNYAQRLGVVYEYVSTISRAYAQVDAMRFQQVMSNLLSNAAKFSRKGGKVEVQLHNVNSNYRVTVVDHGSGISEEFKSRIFDRFSQADSSDTRRHGGTGLGLAISKEIMKHLHGEIGFLSEKDVGSTFWVEIPVLNQPLAAAS